MHLGALPSLDDFGSSANGMVAAIRRAWLPAG